MRKSVTSVIATAFLSAGIAFAATQTVSLSPAFGRNVQTMTAQDVTLNAQDLFHKIDIDRDGIMSIDEYASQAVVLASLARFNGAVVFEGVQTVHVPLPQNTPAEMPRIEKVAIDTSARAEYYALAGTDALLTAQEWTVSQLAEFSRSDRNADGVLKNRELTEFSLAIAKVSSKNS